MPDRARRLWGWLQTPPGIRIVRYTMVSATTMTFSLVMVGIVYGDLRLWSPVPQGLGQSRRALRTSSSLPSESMPDSAAVILAAFRESDDRRV